MYKTFIPTKMKIAFIIEIWNGFIETRVLSIVISTSFWHISFSRISPK